MPNDWLKFWRDTGINQISRQCHFIIGEQLKATTKQTICDEVAEIINKYSTKYGPDTVEKMSRFIGRIGADTLLT
ncbi:hypothetical protein [Runella sp.]|uniref:hypothetical protein n=1 Tax=Runella sp. TaxID=1960881 RepID=UPI003D0C79DB